MRAGEFLERVLPLALLSLAIVTVPVMIWSDGGLARLTKLRAEQQRVEQAVSDLSAEIRRLRAEVEYIKAAPAHVERVARDDLGLVRQTEIVFQFKR